MPPATTRSGIFSRITAMSPAVEVSSMIRASACIWAFIRWKSSSVEFWVPAASTSTSSSRSASTIDQVFTPPVKSTARFPARRLRWGSMRARHLASSSATSASTRSRMVVSASPPFPRSSSRAMSRSARAVSVIP